MNTKTLLSTITTKGQVTLPAAIRHRLNLAAHDRVMFVMDEAGRVELQVPRYQSVADLTGAAGSIGKALSMPQLRQIAYEDRLAANQEGDDWSLRRYRCHHSALDRR